MNLDNCSRCGKLYAKHFQAVCQACIKEIDQEYIACTNYLRANRGATINELSEAASVSVKQIVKFIREGRISQIDGHNLTYTCEMCGDQVFEGRICENCRLRLSKEIEHIDSVKNKSEKPSVPSTFGYLNNRKDK